MRDAVFTLMAPCGGKVDATILIARGPMTVNRRRELTPPQSLISMVYRTDRRWDPTLNDIRGTES